MALGRSLLTDETKSFGQIHTQTSQTPRPNRGSQNPVAQAADRPASGSGARGAGSSDGGGWRQGGGSQTGFLSVATPRVKDDRGSAKEPGAKEPNYFPAFRDGDGPLNA